MGIALIFPGQGSQTKGMGESLYTHSKEVQLLFEEASEILHEDMKALCFKENNKLHLTRYTQPAILLVQLSIYTLLKPKIHNDICFGLGHSLGELSAVSASGAISFANAMALAAKRGQLMEQACGKKEVGMMVILGLEDKVLEEFCEKKRDLGLKVWCANYNGEGQIVLAGNQEDLVSLEVEIKGLGAKRTLMLPISVASHCPLLESICEEFSALLAQYINSDFSFPIISNVSAKAYQTKDQALELLSKQLISPVLYKQSIMQHEEKIDYFIECGGNVLKGLNKRLTQKETLSLQNYAEINDFLNKG